MRHILAITATLVLVFAVNVSRLHAEVRTQRIVSGLDHPLYVTSDPLDSNRLFILEKSGLVKVFDQSTDTLLPTPFLDLSSQVSSADDQGLLGLAFHPDFATNHEFYVNYTDLSGNQQITRYNVSADPNVADASTNMSIMNITQTSSLHNGGWIGFDPSTTNPYLYIAVGDDNIGYQSQGGQVTLQDRQSFNGSILRIDVDGNDVNEGSNHYGIPSTNPYKSDSTAGKEELWAYGLRNPVKASFDSDPTASSTSIGNFYIGDVGANTREEIDFQAADNGAKPSRAKDYGWPQREGDVANPDAIDSSRPVGNIDPLLAIAHGDGQFDGQAITGGYVYRGSDQSIQGQYFYGDSVTGHIYSIDRNSGSTATLTQPDTDWTAMIAPLNGSINSVTSFGEAADGTMFIVANGGEIYRVDPVDDAVTTAAFVDGLYNRVLGRSAETAGRQYWINQLTSQGGLDPASTRDRVAAAFWDSTEHAGSRVDALYNQYLRRSADPDGRAGKVDEIMNQGASDTDIAVEMLTSLEFYRQFLNDAAFIVAVYDRALGRSPSQTELSNLYSALQGNNTREQVVRAIVDSQQGILTAVNDEYNMLLGRAADSSGLTQYANQIRSGAMTSADVATALSTSQEFVYGVLRDAQFGDAPGFSVSSFADALSLAALQSVPQGQQGLAGVAAVPEPGSAVLTALGLICLLGCRRRRS